MSCGFGPAVTSAPRTVAKCACRRRLVSESANFSTEAGSHPYYCPVVYFIAWSRRLTALIDRCITLDSRKLAGLSTNNVRPRRFSMPRTPDRTATFTFNFDDPDLKKLESKVKDVRDNLSAVVLHQNNLW